MRDPKRHHLLNGLEGGILRYAEMRSDLVWSGPPAVREQSERPPYRVGDRAQHLDATVPVASDGQVPSPPHSSQLASPQPARSGRRPTRTPSAMPAAARTITPNAIRKTSITRRLRPGSGR